MVANRNEGQFLFIHNREYRISYVFHQRQSTSSHFCGKLFYYCPRKPPLCPCCVDVEYTTFAKVAFELLKTLSGYILLIAIFLILLFLDALTRVLQITRFLGFSFGPKTVFTYLLFALVISKFTDFTEECRQMEYERLTREIRDRISQTESKNTQTPSQWIKRVRRETKQFDEGKLAITGARNNMKSSMARLINRYRAKAEMLQHDLDVGSRLHFEVNTRVQNYEADISRLKTKVESQRKQLDEQRLNNKMLIERYENVAKQIPLLLQK